jgi:hypothetical protein
VACSLCLVRGEETGKKVIYSRGFEKIYASLMLKLSKLLAAVASWEHSGAEGPRSQQFAVALSASLRLI